MQVPPRLWGYNLFNNDHCCESRTLLTDILRDDWGFGASRSRLCRWRPRYQEGHRAGLDIEMPMPIHYQRNLLKAVEEGRVSEEAVDTAVLRILRTLLVFENTRTRWPTAWTSSLARHTPNWRGKSLRIDGADQEREGRAAVPEDCQAHSGCRGTGNTANTGDAGSSKIDAPYVVTPLEGLRNYSGADAEICSAMRANSTKQPTKQPG